MAPGILHHLTALGSFAMYLNTLALVLAAVTMVVTAEPWLEILNSPRVERFTSTLLGTKGEMGESRSHESMGFPWSSHTTRWRTRVVMFLQKSAHGIPWEEMWDDPRECPSRRDKWLNLDVCTCLLGFLGKSCVDPQSFSVKPTFKSDVLFIVIPPHQSLWPFPSRHISNRG